MLPSPLRLPFLTLLSPPSRLLVQQHWRKFFGFGWYRLRSLLVLGKSSLFFLCIGDGSDDGGVGVCVNVGVGVGDTVDTTVSSSLLAFLLEKSSLLMAMTFVVATCSTSSLIFSISFSPLSFVLRLSFYFL